MLGTRPRFIAHVVISGIRAHRDGNGIACINVKIFVANCRLSLRRAGGDQGCRDRAGRTRARESNRGRSGIAASGLKVEGGGCQTHRCQNTSGAGVSTLRQKSFRNLRSGKSQIAISRARPRVGDRQAVDLPDTAARPGPCSVSPPDITVRHKGTACPLQVCVPCHRCPAAEKEWPVFAELEHPGLMVPLPAEIW